MYEICGANCDGCSFRGQCGGCEATGGHAFGGACVAAEYIRAGGKDKYEEFKRGLLNEINALLEACGMPPAQTLYELPGAMVNLAYPLPSGETVKFLDDTKVYLGAQIECADTGLCCGAAADTGFILLCRYGENGSQPELLLYKQR